MENYRFVFLCCKVVWGLRNERCQQKALSERWLCVKCLHVCTCSHFLLILVWKQTTIKLSLSGLAHRNALLASQSLHFLSSAPPPPPVLLGAASFRMISEGSPPCCKGWRVIFRCWVHMCLHSGEKAGSAIDCLNLSGLQKLVFKTFLEVKCSGKHQFKNIVV